MPVVATAPCGAVRGVVYKPVLYCMPLARAMPCETARRLLGSSVSDYDNVAVGLTQHDMYYVFHHTKTPRLII